MPPRLAGEVQTPLRTILERLNMSQAALARAVGVDKRQVGSWVRGEYVPAPERREQIAREVGVSAVELWPDAEHKAAA
jgi:transcriptional regulator with XRE-family HTH domain